MAEFKKTIKQQEAVRLMSGPSKHLMLYGGARAGKTIIILRQLVIRACKTPSRHAALRKTFNSIKRSLWLDSVPKLMAMAFPDLKVAYNKTDYIMNFPNGSELHFGGLDDGQRVEKILGTEYSTIWYNEASELDYSSVQLVNTRLAQKNSLAKKIFYDANPAQKSHWSYYLFEKKLDPIDNVPLENPEEYASLLMLPNDNLENIDENYLQMLQSMPEKQRNRFLFGLYNDESNGQVYYSFRRDSHVKTVNRPPPGTTIWAGMDFNTNPMTAVLCYMENNRLKVFDEIYLENSDTYRMCDALKKAGYAGITILPDSTGANRKTSGRTDHEILREGGFKVESTRNPFVMDRVNNVNRIFGLDLIDIDPRCRKLCNDLEKVVWKANQLDQTGANKMLTHVSDCLGYAAWKLMPFMPSTAKVVFDAPRSR